MLGVAPHLMEIDISLDVLMRFLKKGKKKKKPSELPLLPHLPQSPAGFFVSLTAGTD